MGVTSETNTDICGKPRAIYRTTCASVLILNPVGNSGMSSMEETDTAPCERTHT